MADPAPGQSNAPPTGATAGDPTGGEPLESIPVAATNQPPIAPATAGQQQGGDDVDVAVDDSDSTMGEDV